MNIKSLLIGSAAALVAATGAKAADAVVVAEPEPLEYVRVCDAYGSGFFYIPGTETCLRISGYVWFQMGANSANKYFSNNVRARLNIDARSDTEWGTLRGFIRVQGNWDPQNQSIANKIAPGTVLVGGAPVPVVGAKSVTPFGTDGLAYIDQAFIELGGLRMGYTESAWAQSKGGGASNWGSHSWTGMSYAYSQALVVAYTFQGGNGFFGTLSLEDDGNSNYVPDVVVKVGVNQGWGAVWAKAAFDEDITPASPPAGTAGARAAGLSGIDGWAGSIGAQINVPNSSGSNVRLIYFYAENGNKFSTGAEHSFLASYKHAFSSTLSASAAIQYSMDTNYALAGSPDAWDAEASVVWFPVTNFEVRAEIHYNVAESKTAPFRARTKTTSGYLRFTRYF